LADEEQQKVISMNKEHILDRAAKKIKIYNQGEGKQDSRVTDAKPITAKTSGMVVESCPNSPKEWDKEKDVKKFKESQRRVKSTMNSLPEKEQTAEEYLNQLKDKLSLPKDNLMLRSMSRNEFDYFMRHYGDLRYEEGYDVGRVHGYSDGFTDGKEEVD
jgi:hypothetical protein